jgi:hypothetical protein
MLEGLYISTRQLCNYVGRKQKVVTISKRHKGDIRTSPSKKEKREPKPPLGIKCEYELCGEFMFSL